MYVILLFDIHECNIFSMNIDVLLTADQTSCIPTLTLGALQLGIVFTSLFCIHVTW